jgi:CBS domain-containing protein
MIGDPRPTPVAHAPPTPKGRAMIASDLQVSLPTVNRKTPAVVAARLIAHAGFAALVLADDDGRPTSLVPAAEVLRLVVKGAASATVGDLLDERKSSVAPILKIDAASPIEEAAERMAEARAAVAVVEADPRAPRFVLLPVVLDALLAMGIDPD